jgi:hypothetical protein
MNSTKTTRVFRKPKGVEDEKVLLESTIPKSTRDSTKWTSKIFHEWQMGRRNQDAKLEHCSFAFDCNKVQNLDTSITQMNGETLNFWLGKFIQEVCKTNGERYPGRTLYAIACGLNRHLQEECEVPVSILDKNETR